MVESNVDIDVESLVVAHYAVDLHMSYEEIQDMMALSRATVARRLQHAKVREWLVEEPRLTIPGHLQEAYEQRVHETELQNRLVDRLERDNCGLRSATIVFDKQVKYAQPHEISQRVGQAAAARLVGVLANRGGTIGINWGHAVRWTIEYLPQDPPGGRPNRKLKFVALMGNFAVEEPEDENSRKVYEEAWQCSSNRLARLAGERLGTIEPKRLNTPAIISSNFRGVEGKLRTIWEFIQEDLSYKLIFGVGHHDQEAGGEAKGLIGEMDTIVTGMSALQADSALVSIARLATPDELEKLRSAGYVGDLGGRPIDDPRAEVVDEKAKEIAGELSQLVIGPLPEDFTRVAEKARRAGDNRTGVFLVSTGRRKARALIAACRRRAVNELFTDRATAVEMLDILGD